MINLVALDHVVFRVRDVPAMLRFYEEVLGARLERTLEEFGLYQIRAGTALIDLVDVNGKLGREGGSRLRAKAVATSITSASRCCRGTARRSSRTLPGMALPMRGFRHAMARKATARASTSPIPKATPSSSRDHPIRRSQPYDNQTGYRGCRRPTPRLSSRKIHPSEDHSP
jgi:catechol 2,3-dioxygenase-like lactoylglutathione lyase family enzyme